MKKNNEDKENISFRDKMKDKKYSAKVQLLAYAIFIIIVIIYANISSRNYNYDYSNKLTNTTNNIKENSEVSQEKALLDTINKNYEYEIQVEIIKEDNSTNTYNYSGSSYDDTQTIITNEKTYYKKNNEYYEEIDNNYSLIEESEIYNSIEAKYIDLQEILNYINKSSLDHTTNYSSGTIVSTYYLYLKDILPNYYEEDYVEFNITENNSILNIEIDYSKLMNYKDKNIINYKVTATYKNIDNVEEINLDINTN